MHRSKPANIALLALIAAIAFAAPARAAQTADAGAPFGELPLVDEILCGAADAGHGFSESPAGASKVETLLGQPCRVMPVTGEERYFAYVLGEGKNLKAGGAYLLTVESPDDAPRTVYIINRGCETIRGFHTGASVGDVMYTYTHNNPESIKIPHTQMMVTWQQFFHLHDRYPEIIAERNKAARSRTAGQGFHVIICQSNAANHPVSKGAAVYRIRLFEVPQPEKFYVDLKLPPKDLPRRHLFWREEMSDGVIGSRNPEERGLTEENQWFEYKARLMKFLGMNTYCKDLLEFGHNQGWDQSPYGGHDWVWGSKTPDRWEKILDIAAKYNFDVLPYYEYCGSIGGKNAYGVTKPCKTLNGEPHYTHITWTEKAYMDVTDPKGLEDAKKLLNATIVRYKDKANILGAWFRTRPSQWPVSFSDRCLALFGKEAGEGKAPTRDELKNNKQLLGKYYDWWLGKRQEFMTRLRDELREKNNPDSIVMLTTDTSEPGVPMKGVAAVTDDLDLWKSIASSPGHDKLAKGKILTPQQVADNGQYLSSFLAWHGTWGKFEWQHACPPPDPARYRDSEGTLLTLTVNRAYTVARPEPFDAFRTKSGLAVIRHYALNENVMGKKVGYFVTDVERAGPYCMLAEARAMANGDPRYIGYLASNCWNRGFPGPVRDFNAAFLALPALPSTVDAKASPDPEVVVRVMPTEKHGTYLAVINTGLTEKRNVAITLPKAGVLTNAATGAALSPNGGKLAVTLAPCSMQALCIAP